MTAISPKVKLLLFTSIQWLQKINNTKSEAMLTVYYPNFCDCKRLDQYFTFLNHFKLPISIIDLWTQLFKTLITVNPLLNMLIHN